MSRCPASWRAWPSGALRAGGGEPPLALDNPDARFLAIQFGPRIAALLATPRQRADAILAYDLIASSYQRNGDNIARAWMVDMNPHLDEQSPIQAIAGGQTDAVLAAARGERDGQHVN
ncbi:MULTISPECIES: hypothetical protein [unclassified Streptomyces]|uniref:hypothetical protein n=1 Tax=unclassified Streptomyces TaxID=2593676 RepID=UPI000886D23E|nr:MULTISPECIES: hypothetical protein [unclassified Streptomyces]PBC87058.1 hypothetical protein BX261_7195 [Streptomyces sp. 2321.6]SDQ62930.1 hypothetical protein SAMN05216511_0053 [Streptomyces sp. KS_16]SEE18018.1 hypothetical protein SAMN05428940_7222 [Streptomyces sp. 2133.1]SNC74235.1 hypothetical protein SAMN06272741_7121 [Streptomyces sp. 2114.4]